MTDVNVVGTSSGDTQWTAMEPPSDPKYMRDGVTSFCQSFANDTLVTIVAPEDTLIFNQQRSPIQGMNTTVTWTYDSPSINTSDMRYSTCVRDTCAPFLDAKNSSSTIQEVSLPGQGIFPLHLRLLWTTPSTVVQCEGIVSVDFSVPTTSDVGHNHVITIVVVITVVMGFVVLATHIYRRRRSFRSKPTDTTISVDLPPSMSLAPPAPSSTWFESIYHNDRALPASILHDDRFTRAILRSSVPSDHDQSFHSDLLDSVADSSVTSSSSMNTPWHDCGHINSSNSSTVYPMSD
ncbi:hypothetical protein DYB37_007063 [Aphanomyces astaci]|uniref:Uncharacterized protein n=2 Tax=Aphanomyces astaci TaxID=112090 RepID=A0A3R7BFY2_APHAT|nr:hypothetical protein DYB35_003257 [Aphanomyces astaci]RHZ27640.1 hypothetical protein DYB37_007063 [Aphanomyces astaci]